MFSLSLVDAERLCFEGNAEDFKAVPVFIKNFHHQCFSMLLIAIKLDETNFRLANCLSSKLLQRGMKSVLHHQVSTSSVLPAHDVSVTVFKFAISLSFKRTTFVQYASCSRTFDSRFFSILSWKGTKLSFCLRFLDCLTHRFRDDVLILLDGCL